MIRTGNLKESANTTTMFDTKELVHLVKVVLSNSKASLYFLIKGPPAVNIQEAAYPVAFKLSVGNISWSTYTCRLGISWLPHEMIEAHIVPGLQHSSPISTHNSAKRNVKW
jgi:hypothetical protein